MSHDSAPVPALALRNVHKHYGATHALRDLTLEIPQGEIFALLGENGAGKSTLIHCITGLARQSRGEILVFGHDTVRDFRMTRRLVGLVPQEISFDPFFSPLESLELQMGLMGVKPNRAKAEALLELFSLADKRHAYTRTLSGGMKRRLLVAKALVHQPRLLFLDEPSAGVDVSLRKDLWRIVRELRDQGTTIVLTTHYLEEAEALADRVGIIHRGRLLLVATRQGLMEEHARRDVLIRYRTAPLNAPLPAGWRWGVDHRVEVSWTKADELLIILQEAAALGEIKEIDFAQRHLEDIFVDLIAHADDGAAKPHLPPPPSAADKEEPWT